MISKYLIFSIGILAQLLFSARILIQWIMSEKERKVLSPSIFWILSIIASILLFLYGWLRNDFAIMLGQCISYYIYIWNLYEKGVWQKLNILFRKVVELFPVAGLIYIMFNWDILYYQWFRNEDIPILLLIYGSAGQIIFTLRFIYQYFYSSRIGESVLPKGFWVISLIGSAIIVSYGIFRLDPIIILGQSFGFVSYIRNLVILHKSKELINK